MSNVMFFFILKLQDLIFLVRDKKMAEKKCNEYLDYLLTEEKGFSAEFDSTRATVKGAFSLVKLVCLPAPGETVEDLSEDKSEIDETGKCWWCK